MAACRAVLRLLLDPGGPEFIQQRDRRDQAVIDRLDLRLDRRVTA